MLSQEIKQAIDGALAARIAFVAYVRPNSDEAIFFADIPGRDVRDADKFIVSGWSSAAADRYVIHNRSDAVSTIAYLMSGACQSSDVVEVWNRSTSHSEYSKSLDNVIEHLQDHGGKVVVSRTISGDSNGIVWSEVADRYFAVHPEAFRYIYFTPRHGAWLGASPELLLNVTGNDFLTMALAGTRSVSDTDCPWSGKNIAEQAVVRNYIVDRLYDLGLNPQCGPTETMTTGNLQHLRTLISGSLESVSPEEIIRAINPTPALAGFPLATALEQIAQHEHHPRRCYGGYLAISSACDFTAYVNLRCVNFDSRHWCMYVGSGIMPESDIDDEWRETENKSSVLRKIIDDSRK